MSGACQNAHNRVAILGGNISRSCKERLASLKLYVRTLNQSLDLDNLVAL